MLANRLSCLLIATTDATFRLHAAVVVRLVESQEKCDILASARSRPLAKSQHLRPPADSRASYAPAELCTPIREASKTRISPRCVECIYGGRGRYELLVVATESTQINLHISSVSFEVSYDDRRFQVDTVQHSVSDISLCNYCSQAVIQN